MPQASTHAVPHPPAFVYTGKLKPYTVKTYEGMSVGIVGIDVQLKTMASSSPDPGTVLLDQTETAQKYIDELKEMGGRTPAQHLGASNNRL